MGGLQCDAGANEFIANVFKDCVYNFRDYTGFILGLASLITWMIAQAPQLYSNYKNKSAEALSVWFLGEWLLGDTCNLIGCLLTGNQLVTQIYTAMYFVCADVMLCVQYVYYKAIRHQRLRAQRSSRYRTLPRQSDESYRSSSTPSGLHSVANQSSTTKLRVLACVAIFGLGSQFLGGGGLHSFSLEGTSAHSLYSHGRVLTADMLQSKGDAAWREAVGQAIGWVSSILYLGSRLSQIYKTWHRQSAEGLSVAMFCCAISANLMYGAGILIRTYRWEDLVTSAPWLLGSLGTVALDIIIFGQFYIYDSFDDKQRARDDPQAELLAEEHPL